MKRIFFIGVIFCGSKLLASDYTISDKGIHSDIVTGELPAL
jgi:hypothetical protein